jgi:hypothetical protein
MAIENEFLLKDHQLIPYHHYVYLLDIVHHFYPQLPKNKLTKENVMDVFIRQEVESQLNIQDISESVKFCYA